MKDRFFDKVDWAAFWLATLVTFAVYFYTLGPSVGLEDSGELATAAAHLGVPHPPGYPFWTLCSWLFCKLFGWVTYMGHPTPAWAVSCFSAFAGAFASGCTAMLICRSSRDMLEGDDRATSLLAFAGGVGGALAFSFSPVEWSQSTIVEIYSLNALFLMWVFLLSYRWMRRPSDKVLWAAAFVFGLGLTNYQVLVFAIVPMAMIICLRNFRMFRDFALYLIPAYLVYQALSIGDLQRASSMMQSDVINKHIPLAGASSCPSTAAVVAAIVLLVGGLVAAAVLKGRGRTGAALKAVAGGCGAAVGVFLLSALGLFAGAASWVGVELAPDGRAYEIVSSAAPLVDPRTYAWIAAFAAASVACGVGAAIARGDAAREALRRKLLLASAGFAALAVLVAVCFVDTANSAGYTGPKYPWTASVLVFVAFVIALFACAMFVENGLAYAIPVAGFQIALFVLLKKGAMNGLVHPASWWFWWPLAWNFVVLALAWITLPHGRSVAGAALFAQLGVSFYAYMPIVSDLRNPPMNWAYPRTWAGFKHAIMRGQYEAITMPDFQGVGALLDYVKTQMTHYFKDIKIQFSDFLAFFALVPFACWRFFVRRRGGRRAYQALAAVAAVIAFLLVRAVMAACGLGGGVAMEFVDRVLIAFMAAVCLVGVCVIVYRQVVRRALVSLRRFVRSAVLRGDRARLWAMGALGLACVLGASARWAVPGGRPTVLMAVLAVVVASASFALAAKNPLRSVRRCVTRPGFASFSASPVSQQWLFASGVCFLMMSVLLIVLAKVTGTIQDGFIQKVKFISSHAMIAMWIGYGIAFIGAAALRLASRWEAVRRRPALFAAALAAVAVVGSSVAPIVQNYTDDDLVLRYGGSEQNDHTFGWQFGAFQLEGANAIRAFLTEDDEPLPDPDWPPPMEDHAVFFGGTDPGRFVPTYMIYSAKYRPDVYLITQNALADETYMSVERDLYGDEIWIPSSADLNGAFDIYVREVQSGKRRAKGNLSIVNGKVQVTGALGVMEINAILSNQMFEHEKTRHAFYIEESYPMPWMYPYLSPNGLIMKINPEPQPYDPAVAAKDSDFWDWYGRRLVSDPMYRRDFAAQKSFSKLRTALAGMYYAKGRVQEAAAAYRDALSLYPLAAEAWSNYIRDIIFPRPRMHAVGKDLARWLQAIEPNSPAPGEILRQLDAIEYVQQNEREVYEGRATAAGVRDLASRYMTLGRDDAAAHCLARVLPAMANPDDLRNAAAVFKSVNDHAHVVEALTRYAAAVRSPEPMVLLDLAIAQHSVGKLGEAYQTIDGLARTAPRMVAEPLTQYVLSLPPDKCDYMLLLKTASLLNKAGMRRQAVNYFRAAYQKDPQRVEAECQFNRELKSLKSGMPGYIR